MGALGKHEPHEIQGACSVVQGKNLYTQNKISDSRSEGTFKLRLTPST